MLRVITKTGVFALMVAVLCSCSSIEVRSPIVFKKSKPEEQPAPSEKTQIPPSSQIAKADGQTPAPSPTTPEERKGTIQEVPVQAAIDITRTPPVQEDRTTILSPADIPVFSSQDLANYKFSVLGQVEVKAPAREGFTQEKALQNLKVEAYKRYGSLAQGVTNIAYARGITGLASKQDRYESVSADVITVTKRTSLAPGEEAKTIPPLSSVPGGIPTEGREEELPQLSNIAIISSDDLFTLNFKILGTVSVFDESRKGFTEEQAIRNLRIEAFRLYGIQAMALTKIKLIKEARVFYYRKTRSNESPQEPKGFIKATAEVVTWLSDSRAAHP